jgi:hypothetical protein
MNRREDDPSTRPADGASQPVSPAYNSEADAPTEGPRTHDAYHDTSPRGEQKQQNAELDAGDDPAEGSRDVGAPAAETAGDEGVELEEVQDTPKGATEEMTVRSDEEGALPDEKVDPMNLPDSAMPSEIAPTVGGEEPVGNVPTQDNTGGRWNVDQIAPAPPETGDLQEAFNPTSNPDEPHGEVF